MYPQNTQIFSIGDSVEGRPLVGMRICGNKHEYKPAVVFHGTTHAREWISPAVSALEWHAIVALSFIPLRC